MSIIITISHRGPAYRFLYAQTPPLMPPKPSACPSPSQDSMVRVIAAYAAYAFGT